LPTVAKKDAGERKYLADVLRAVSQMAEDSKRSNAQIKKSVAVISSGIPTTMRNCEKNFFFVVYIL